MEQQQIVTDQIVVLPRQIWQPDVHDWDVKAMQLFGSIAVLDPSSAEYRQHREVVAHLLSISPDTEQDKTDLGESMWLLQLLGTTLPENASDEHRGRYFEAQKLGRMLARRTFADAGKEYHGRELSFIDPMTGLLNPNGRNDRLGRWLTGQTFQPDRRFPSRREVDKNIYACFVDICNFKRINGTFGHPFGDQCIVEAARELFNTVRASDNLALVHRSGDEFEAVGHMSLKEMQDFVNRFHGAQLEKARDGRYIKIWEKIWELEQSYGENFRATIEITGPREKLVRMLAINGKIICPLKDILVQSIGLCSKPAQSVEDYDADIITNYAERAAEHRKDTTLYPLIGGADRPE